MNQPAADQEAAINRIGGIVMQIAGPALAILVTYSIAGFLAEAAYQGPLVDRVKWIFLLFCFAAVLISRISIELGSERAAVFGWLLGAAVFITTSRLLQGNPVVLVTILTFVWWAAGRLTWDCTFVDSSRDATGQGMIDLALERVERFRNRKGGHKEDPKGTSQLPEIPPDPDVVGLPPDSQNKPTGLWSRFVQVFWSRKQANTPGLWAFYFLLMGLPLFGLGQIMLRMTDGVGHQAATFHFFFYIVGLLGLLMLSSMLGLHRYLKLNQSAMPPALARKWMITGTILAIGIALVCLLLPRPTARYSIATWLPKMTARAKGPSGFSRGNDGQQQGDKSNASTGPESRSERKTDAGESNKKGNDEQDTQKDQANDNAEKGDRGPKRDADSGDQPGGKSDNGAKEDDSNQNKKNGNQSGNQKGDKQQESQGNEGEQKQDGDSQQQSDEGKESQDSGESENDDQSDGKEEDAEKSDRQERGGLKKPDDKSQKQESEESNSGRSRQRNRSEEQQRQPQPNEQQKNEKKETQKKQNQSTPPSKSPMEFVKQLIQLIFWAVFAVVLVWFLVRYRQRIAPWLRSFLKELSEFWARLWGQKKEKKQQPSSNVKEVMPETPPPGFDSFRNPFVSGAAGQWPVERLIEYSFQALEAWTRDREFPRPADQTAMEFAKAVSVRFRGLDAEARQLANMYSQLAYASDVNSISRETAMTLAGLWDKLSAP